MWLGRQQPPGTPNHLQTAHREYSEPGPSSVMGGGCRPYVSLNHWMSFPSAALRSMPVS